MRRFAALSWLLLFSLRAAAEPSPKQLPPLKVDQPIIVGLRQNPPNMFKRPDGKWTGLGVEMWKLVATDLGIPYELKAMDEKVAFLEEVKKYDIFPALSVRLRNEDQLDLTHAFITNSLSIAVRDEPQSSFNYLRSIFSPRLLKGLGLLLLLVLLMGVVVWSIERRTIPEEFGGKPARGIFAGVAWTVEALVGKARPLSRTPSARIFNLFWTLVCVGLVSGVTAKLSSDLTVEKLQSRINGPQDLHRFRVGAGSGLSSDYLTALSIRHTNYGNDDHALFDALVRGDIDAIVGVEKFLQYYEKNGYTKKIRVLPVTFNPFNVGIGLRPGLSILPHLNRSILKVMQSDAWKQAQMNLVGAAN